jgi:hypothetical protein
MYDAERLMRNCQLRPRTSLNPAENDEIAIEGYIRELTVYVQATCPYKVERAGMTPECPFRGSSALSASLQLPDPFLTPTTIRPALHYEKYYSTHYQNVSKRSLFIKAFVDKALVV